MLCTPKKSCECRPRVQEDLHFSPLPTCTEVFDLTASFDTVSPIVLSSIFLNLFRMQKDFKANMFHTNLSRRYELRCHSFYFSWRQPNLLNTLKRGRVTCRRFTFIPSIHSVIFSFCLTYLEDWNLVFLLPNLKLCTLWSSKHRQTWIMFFACLAHSFLGEKNLLPNRKNTTSRVTRHRQKLSIWQNLVFIAWKSGKNI